MEASERDAAARPRDAASPRPMGILGGTLLLGRGMFGVGALSMPYMITLCGPWAGLLLLVLFGVNQAVMASAVVAAAPGCSSYEEATRAVLGKGAERFLAANIFLANFGTAAAYLVTFGSRLSSAFAFWGMSSCLAGRGQVIAIGGVLLLPMVFPSKLRGIQFSAAFSLAAAAAAVLAIIWDSAGSAPEAPAPPVDASSFMRGIPLVCFAFSSMSVVFPVYAEMDASKRRPRSITHAMSIAAFTAGSLYAASGLLAARRFGSDTMPDVLGNFEVSNPSTFHVLGAAYALACLLGVPLMLFPSRRSLNFLLGYSQDQLELGWQPVLKLESLVLVCAACALAIASKSILNILDVIGSVSAIAVDAVLPGIMFLFGTRSVSLGSFGGEDADESGLRTELSAVDATAAAQSEGPTVDADESDAFPKGVALKVPRWQRVAVSAMAFVAFCAGLVSFVFTVQNKLKG